MLTKLGTEVGIDPKCKGKHDPEEANLFKNKYQQRYLEYKCDCTSVYSAMSRPEKSKTSSREVKGNNMSVFVRELFEE